MHCVEKRNEIGVQFKHVALNERQWVVWLRLDVHPNDVEPGRSCILSQHHPHSRTNQGA